MKYAYVNEQKLVKEKVLNYIISRYRQYKNRDNTAFIIGEDGNGDEIVRKLKWTNTTNVKYGNWF